MCCASGGRLRSRGLQAGKPIRCTNAWKSRVGAEIVDAGVGFDVPGEFEGFLVVRLFKELHCFIFFAESRVDGCENVRRGFVIFRSTLEVVKDFFRFGFLSCHSVCVCEGCVGILIAVR